MRARGIERVAQLQGGIHRYMQEGFDDSLYVSMGAAWFTASAAVTHLAFAPFTHVSLWRRDALDAVLCGADGEASCLSLTSVALSPPKTCLALL